MMASKKVTQKTEQIQKDVRNVMFFIFFALTVGASSGLLGHIHSAFNTQRVAVESQLSAVYIPGVDKPGEVVYDIRDGNDERGYQIQIEKGQYLQYFPAHNDYYIRTACTPAEGCNSGYSYDGPYGSNEEFIIGMKEVVNSSGWDIVDYLNLVRRESDHNISASPEQLRLGSAEQSPLLVSSEVDSSPSRTAPLLGSSSNVDALPSTDITARTAEDNRCSTTYVVANAAGVPKTRDCYGSESDEALPAVQELAKCIAIETQHGGTPDAIAGKYQKLVPALTNSMCKGQSAQRVTDIPQSSIILQRDPNIVYPTNIKSIPQACAQQYDKVVWLMGGINNNPTYFKAATNATYADAQACAYKGAVVCYQTNPNNTESIECKRKADIATGVSVDTAQPTTVAPPAATGSTTVTPSTPSVTDAACKGFTCFFNNLLKDKKIQKTFGSIVSNWLTGSKGGCPSGYVPTGSTTTGTTTKTSCAPEPKVVQPQCAMAAQKTTIAAGENVLVRWKTAQAESVTISGIGDGVALNGEATVSPKTTTTYTLTATNGSATKECKTTVAVDGQLTGPTGAHPPTLSCTPGRIRKDEVAHIAWTCPAPATDSAGEGIATRGALSGSIDATPGSSAEYVVKCFNGDKEIGRNVCAVAVGAPQYDIIAYPTEAAPAERVRISWASLFMKSCHVTGPRGFNYTHIQGVVVTEPFDAHETGTLDDAVYTLECATEFGDTVQQEVVVGAK